MKLKNERNFIDRKKDGIPCVIIFCLVENRKVRTAFPPGTRSRILTPKFKTILFPYWVVHIFLCAQ